MHHSIVNTKIIMRIQFVFILMAMTVHLAASEVRSIGPMVNAAGKSSIYLVYSEDASDKIMAKFEENAEKKLSLIAVYQIAIPRNDISFEIFEHEGRRIFIFSSSNGPPKSRVTKVWISEIDDKTAETHPKIRLVSPKLEPELWRKGLLVANQAPLILETEAAVIKMQSESKQKRDK